MWKHIGVANVVFCIIIDNRYPLEKLPCPNCGDWDEYKMLESDEKLRTCPTAYSNSEFI